VAVAIFLLCPLQLCYDSDDNPEIGDIIHAILDVGCATCSVAADDVNGWKADSPHQAPPNIPDVEKVLPPIWPDWIVVHESGSTIELTERANPLRQHFLQPWSRPPPNA
jgi:hypothetical protein